MTKIEREPFITVTLRTKELKDILLNIPSDLYFESDDVFGYDGKFFAYKDHTGCYEESTVTFLEKVEADVLESKESE